MDMASPPNATRNATGQCILNQKGPGEVILSTVLLFINVILIIGLMVQIKRLTTRVIASYAFNVVVVSFLACVIRVLEQFTEFYGDPVLGQSYSMATRHADTALGWWLFVKSTMVIFFVVFYGSIALITLALTWNLMQQSGTVAGFASHKMSPSKSVRGRCAISERVLAGLLIALVWMVPTVAIVVSTGVSNCSKQLKCPFGYSPKNKTQNIVDNLSVCSKVIIPMAKQTMYVGLAFCSIAIILLVFCLLRALYWYHLIRSRLARKNTNQESGVLSGSQSGTASAGTPPDQMVTSTPKKSKSGHLLLSKTKKELIVIFAISVVYVIGTMFLIVHVMVADHTDAIQQPGANSSILSLVFTNLPTCAETLASVLLCIYMNPLNNALKANLYAIAGCFSSLF